MGNDQENPNAKIKEKSKDRTKEKLSPDTKKVSTRRRKITKAQEAKKKIIFEKIQNQWTFAKLHQGDQERLCFMHHSSINGASVSKMQQIILAGDLLSDGIYEVQDYRLEERYDVRAKKDIIVLYLRKYELTYGKFTDKKPIKDEKELRDYLVSNRFLTAVQFDDFFYRNQMPEGIDLTEIRLEFDEFN